MVATKTKAEKRKVCKKILSEAKEAIDQDVEQTNKVIERNNKILSAKARYVSEPSSSASSYSYL